MNDNSQDNRKILIASFFLPVSNKIEKASTEIFPPPLSQSASFITSMRLSHEQSIKAEEPVLIHSTNSTFSSTNSGNPGLYNAVASVKNEIGKKTLWIGTVGGPTDHLSESDRNILSERLVLNHQCLPIFVEKEEFDGHYHNFCKQTLWKPFHYQLPDSPKAKLLDGSSWKMYIRVTLINYIGE
jgi:trehalose-6-phosphate synthase